MHGIGWTRGPSRATYMSILRTEESASGMCSVLGRLSSMWVLGVQLDIDRELGQWQWGRAVSARGRGVAGYGDVYRRLPHRRALRGLQVPAGRLAAGTLPGDCACPRAHPSHCCHRRQLRHSRGAPFSVFFWGFHCFIIQGSDVPSFPFISGVCTWINLMATSTTCQCRSSGIRGLKMPEVLEANCGCRVCRCAWRWWLRCLCATVTGCCWSGRWCTTCWPPYWRHLSRALTSGAPSPLSLALRSAFCASANASCPTRR